MSKNTKYEPGDWFITKDGSHVQIESMFVENGVIKINHTIVLIIRKERQVCKNSLRTMAQFLEMIKE